MLPFHNKINDAYYKCIVLINYDFLFLLPGNESGQTHLKELINAKLRNPQSLDRPDTKN